MALDYPLDLDVFWDRLNVGSVTEWDCPPVGYSATLGDGVRLFTEVMPPAWRCGVDLQRGASDGSGPVDVVAIGALIRALRPNGTFLAYDLRRPAPKLDPDGSILGGASVVVDSIAANTTRLRLSGLPAGYEFSEGDYISILHSGGRRCLRQIVEAASADGSGVTDLMQLSVYLDPGVQAGDVVTLIKPSVKMMMVDGSPGGFGFERVTSGARFSAVEVP